MYTTIQASMQASSSSAPDLLFRSQLQQGQPRATQQFFETYFPRVYRRVLQQVREQSVAEDLTQDIFLRIQRSLPRFEPAKPLGPWIATIVKNRITDHWRSRGLSRDTLSLDQLEVSRGVGAVSCDSPSAGQEHSEAVSIVQRAINGLPKSLRSVLQLRVYEGLSFDAIGELLELTSPTARKRYSRALEALRSSGPLAQLHTGADGLGFATAHSLN